VSVSLGELNSALARRDRAKIVEATRRLIDERAPLAGDWINLAKIAAQYGEIGLGRAAAELAVEHAAPDPAAGYVKVQFLAQIGAWEETLELLRSLPEDRPDPSSYGHSRGTTALYLGELEEARHYLLQAIRYNPHYGSGWLSLAILVDFAREPELVEQIVAAEPDIGRMPESEQSIFYHALGKAHADCGNHALAFAAFARGAAIAKAQRPYNREQFRTLAADAVAGYTTDRIAEIAQQQQEPNDRAIFVMGLPRSGTTLVSQILNSHSAVSGGAEIYLLGLLIDEMGGMRFPALANYVDQKGTAEAAQLWNHWLAERFPGPGRVVDKTTTNTFVTGFAASLLPEAPLIWLTRDPLDCAWSCFHTHFVGEAHWSHDLEDIAYHFRLHDEMLARWRDILGPRLLVVPYEELVTDPEAWIRRILAHCGLPEEPQVFAPHTSSRAVSTASSMQVRRPISRSSIGTAEPYREFLKPFIEAYYA
jgi:tetratricopeptide (TPR) repeat protein